MLSSKERVLMAINHEETDRVPMDYWAWAEVNDKLREQLSLEDYDELLDYLGIDIRVVRAPYVGESGYWDGLRGAKTVEDLEKCELPDPDMFDYSNIERLCDKYSYYAVMGGAWSPVFCTASGLIGMETLMVKTYEEPEFVKLFLEKITDLFYEQSVRIFEVANGKMDIFFIGDDYGTQRGLIMCEEDWDEFYAPHMAKLFSLAKDFGLKVMLHSCGSVSKLIPRLIELGMDALDPIQTRAANMEPEMLKAEFGDSITFHGGLDTQHILPFGTVEEVRAESKRLIEIFGEGGGYIFGPSQEFLPDIPLENILAMYEVGREM
ncbi:uroporphyrinogen decarboxylase family protein [Candidatus Poribacteria bacterium]